jgi:hypothetical protein
MDCLYAEKPNGRRSDDVLLATPLLTRLSTGDNMKPEMKKAPAIRENIWTRQRKLQVREKDLLGAIRSTFKGLVAELDHDDWRSAAISADELTGFCVEQEKLEIELFDVTGIVDAFDRINERMEKLESTLIEEGIGI